MTSAHERTSANLSITSAYNLCGLLINVLTAQLVPRTCCKLRSHPSAICSRADWCRTKDQTHVSRRPSSRPCGCQRHRDARICVEQQHLDGEVQLYHTLHATFFGCLPELLHFPASGSLHALELLGMIAGRIIAHTLEGQMLPHLLHLLRTHRTLQEPCHITDDLI